MLVITGAASSNFFLLGGKIMKKIMLIVVFFTFILNLGIVNGVEGNQELSPVVNEKLTSHYAIDETNIEYSYIRDSLGVYLDVNSKVLTSEIKSSTITNEHIEYKEIVGTTSHVKFACTVEITLLLTCEIPFVDRLFNLQRFVSYSSQLDEIKLTRQIGYFSAQPTLGRYSAWGVLIGLDHIESDLNEMVEDTIKIEFNIEGNYIVSENQDGSGNTTYENAGSPNFPTNSIILGIVGIIFISIIFKRKKNHEKK